MKIKTIIGSLLMCAISSSLWAQQHMLIYCGITQVRPITELAKTFEVREKVKIQIAQGGSEDLFQSAKKSGLGDLYLPGEPSYYQRHLGDGLFGKYKIVGYNQMAIVVQKGNPKGVKGDLSELLRKDLTVIVGNAESGSVGQETQAMLQAAKLYPKVVAKSVALMPDSRAINLALRRGEADVALNWRATAHFPDNAVHLEAVDLDPRVAKPQALLLIELKSTKNPVLVSRFIDFVASEEGQAVFRKYGFLDNLSLR